MKVFIVFVWQGHRTALGHMLKSLLIYLAALLEGKGEESERPTNPKSVSYSKSLLPDKTQI